jgi:putative heme transporter
VIGARRTDNVGRYAVADMTPGSYTLPVSAPSCRPAALAVSPRPVRRGSPAPAGPAPDRPQAGPPAREPGPRRFLRGLLNLAVTLGCLGGLAWLLAAQPGQLGRAIAGVGHAKLGVVVAAVFCERVSMISFARVQVRLLRAAGGRLTLASAIGIIFAGNALSVSVPIAGPGLAVAFTYRELQRHKISRPAAAFALVVSGALSTMSLMVIVAAGLLAYGNAVAAAFGPLLAAAVVAGIAGVVSGLRVPACRRLLKRTAAGAVRAAQRLRRKSGEPPETVVGNALRQLADLHLHLRRSGWAVAVGLAFLNWLGDAACLALSIRAAGLAIPLRDLLLVWSAGIAASGIGLTPGGVGVVEVALVAALTGIGMPAAGAAVAVMIYRLISLWLVLLIGWILFTVIRSRRARRTGLRGVGTDDPPGS